jgi:Tfp pilus assembly protein PilV
MAVLGHLTEKQALHYVRQANRIKLADDAVAQWELNVVPLRVDGTCDEQSVAELEKATGKTVAK